MFEIIYFSADAETPSQETREKRQLWQEYCSEIEYVSIPETHMRMLSAESARLIAEHINRRLDGEEY